MGKISLVIYFFLLILLYKLHICPLQMELCYVLLLLAFTAAASSFDWERLRLPLEHIPYYFNNNPQLKDICAEDSTCPYKVSRVVN